LDLALEKQERTLMELVYGHPTAEAEREVPLAVKAEPVVESASGDMAAEQAA
jgi:hypothetical protein